MPYQTLSFADRSAKCLWLPSSSSDTLDANNEGRRRAVELIDFMQRSDMPFLLGHVTQAIAAKGKFGPLEAGFYHQISLYALHSEIRNSPIMEQPSEVVARPSLRLVT